MNIWTLSMVCICRMYLLCKFIYGDAIMMVINTRKWIVHSESIEELKQIVEGVCYWYSRIALSARNEKKITPNACHRRRHPGADPPIATSMKNELRQFANIGIAPQAINGCCMLPCVRGGCTWRPKNHLQHFSPKPSRTCGATDNSVYPWEDLKRINTCTLACKTQHRLTPWYMVHNTAAAFHGMKLI